MQFLSRHWPTCCVVAAVDVRVVEWKTPRAELSEVKLRELPRLVRDRCSSPRCRQHLAAVPLVKRHR